MPSIDEPSVPVKDANLDCVGSQESVVSQECVVSESGGLSEAGPSEVFYVTSGDSLEQLASCLLSKMNELQSDRGCPPQYRVIPLWVVVVGLLLPLPIFFFFFFYEWEHGTGTMCPFLSLHPLKKGKEV